MQVLPEMIESFRKKYPHDLLAEKNAVSAKDLENAPLILPRRTNVQNELTNWLGDSFQSFQVVFTSNLSPELKANSALAWKKQQPFSLAATRFIEYTVQFLF